MASHSPSLLHEGVHLIKTLFTVGVFTYLFVLLVEILFPGAVSNFFPLRSLLFSCTLLGLILEIVKMVQGKRIVDRIL